MTTEAKHMRWIAVGALVLALAVPASAAADRSPGYLYYGEAAGSIRNYVSTYLDLDEYSRLGTLVGDCRRVTYARVSCLGEVHYTSDVEDFQLFCRMRFVVTEAHKTGRHQVTAGHATCDQESVFA